MKKLFATLAVTVLAIPALAGESCELQASSRALTAFRCENRCPLAAEANVLRANGSEALAASKVARAELALAVEQNLARI